MNHKAHGGISGYFVTHPVTANLLMIIIIVAGVLTALGLRKEVMTSIEPDTITITVSYESGSAEQSEQGIALKIEEAVKGLDGIKRVRSTSTGGSVSVFVQKTSEQKLQPLFDDVKNKVDAISNLPTSAEKPVIEKEKWEDHAINLQLTGDVDQNTLQSLALKLKKQLLKKAVSPKSTWWEREHRFFPLKFRMLCWNLMD